MKEFEQAEKEACSEANYSDHRVMDIRKVWAARAAGMPDPEWGTLRPSVAKRLQRGEPPLKRQAHKLSKEQIAYIRASNASAEALAERFLVTVQTIQYHRNAAQDGK